MKKNLTLKNSLGYLGFVLAGVLIIFSNRIYAALINFVINNLSSDHEINLLTKFKVGASFAGLIGVIFLVSIFLTTNLGKWIEDTITELVNVKKLSSFLIDDEICTKSSQNFFTLLIGSLAGGFVYFYYLFTGIVQNEGKMEYYTTFLFPVAILIMAVTMLRVNKMRLPRTLSNRVLIGMAAIAILIFIYFGEEISWGQQLFHWKSAEIFTDYNFQKETNVHNFLNPLFKYLYPIAGFFSFTTLLLLWIFPGKKINFAFKFFLPHRSMFLLLLLFACTTFLDYREVSEEVFAVICLFYSVRLYYCTKYPASTEQIN